MFGILSLGIPIVAFWIPTGLMMLLDHLIGYLLKKKRFFGREESSRYSSASLRDLIRDFLVFLHRPLFHRNTVERECRGYIDSIKFLKDLSEEYEAVDPSFIKERLKYAHNSYPNKLWDLEKKDFYKAIPKIFKESNSREDIKLFYENVSELFPIYGLQGYAMMDLLLDRAIEENQELWEFESPVKVADP